MKKWILKLVSILLLVIIPITVLFAVTENIPNQYEKTYLAEINDKYNRLHEDNKQKIVFIGDSSLPFGLRSDLIEEKLPDYKVVNYGLYGTIGTKFMMDTSKGNIQKGDIYIISPGISEQMYSLYFNPEVILQACDGMSNKYKELSWDDNWKLIYKYFDFMKQKLAYARNGNAPDPIGIYRHDSFNEYGDIKVNRERNIMVNGYDSSNLITMNDALLNSDFINYVNNYVTTVRNKGAKVYFSFAPANQKAVTTSYEKRLEWQEKLSNKLACDLLCDVDDAVMNSGYFYDTNAHLNSTGTIVYTNLMIKNLKRVLNRELPTDKYENPLPPDMEERPVIEPEEHDDPIPFDEYRGEPNNDYLDWFNYRLVGSSYELIGVKDEHKNMKEVILPSTYEHKNITTIASDALYGCVDLKVVHIGNTYRALKEKAFNGAIGLEKIYFYCMDGNEIAVPQTGLFDGCNRDVKVYVPLGSNFANGYTWMNYVDRFVYYEL